MPHRQARGHQADALDRQIHGVTEKCRVDIDLTRPLPTTSRGIAASLPLGRPGLPADVARAVRYIGGLVLAITCTRSTIQILYSPLFQPVISRSTCASFPGGTGLGTGTTRSLEK